MVLPTNVLGGNVLLGSRHPTAANIAPGVRHFIHFLDLWLACRRGSRKARGRRVAFWAIAGKMAILSAFVTPNVGGGLYSWVPSTCVKSCGEFVDGHVKAGDLIVAFLGGRLWSPEALALETLVLGLEGPYDGIPVHREEFFIDHIVDGDGLQLEG
jgi:hypothetical protein